MQVFFQVLCHRKLAGIYTYKLYVFPIMHFQYTKLVKSFLFIYIPYFVSNNFLLVQYPHSVLKQELPGETSSDALAGTLVVFRLLMYFFFEL